MRQPGMTQSDRKLERDHLLRGEKGLIVCQLCGKQVPCPCDHAAMEARARAEVNHQRWLEEGRAEGLPAPRSRRVA